MTVHEVFDRVLGKLSVLRLALLIAMFGAGLGATFKYLEVEGLFGFDIFIKEWAISGTVLSTFQGIVGFMLTFRTSQAYARYMAACTLIQQMEGSFCDSCSSLLAFAKISNKEHDEVLKFRQTLVCLFSLLSAFALRTLMRLADPDYHEEDDKRLNILYAENLSKETFGMIRRADHRVLLVNHWIQSYIAKHLSSGLLNIPPPILTRAYSELADGIIRFEDSLKLVLFPFPGEYSRTTFFLLVLDTLLTPFALCEHADKCAVVGIFSFCFLCTFWCLFLTSEQLECPFGTDSLDLNMIEWQTRANQRLTMLISVPALHEPELTETIPRADLLSLDVILREESSDSDESGNTINTTWGEIAHSLKLQKKHCRHRVDLQTPGDESQSLLTSASGLIDPVQSDSSGFNSPSSPR